MISSKPTGVFREIFRALGVFVGLIGFFFIAIIVVIALFIWNREAPPARNAIEIQGAAGEPPQRLRLQQASGVFSETTEVISVTKESDSNVSSYSSFKTGRSPSNYLFINNSTGESAWLFNHTNYMITRIAVVASCKKCEPGSSATAPFIASVVTSDTNRNSFVLYLLRSNGTQLTEMTDSKNASLRVDNLISARLIDPSTIAIIYQKGNKIYRQTVSAKTFTSTGMQEIQTWDGKPLEAIPESN